MELIKSYVSPNHYNGRNGWKPDMIVNHITASSASSAINTFMNKTCEKSSHFIVAKDGKVYQMVDLKNGAWCNGTTSNGDNRDYRKATSQIVKSRSTNCNNYTISIEHENIGGGLLTEAQLQATIELHKYIQEQIKSIYGVDIPADRQHIIGHCEVSPITKPCCPGASFPFDEIIEGMKSDTGAPHPFFKVSFPHISTKGECESIAAWVAEHGYKVNIIEEEK